MGVVLHAHSTVIVLALLSAAAMMFAVLAVTLIASPVVVFNAQMKAIALRLNVAYLMNVRLVVSLKATVIWSIPRCVLVAVHL